jgi:hypothetical protein
MKDVASNNDAVLTCSKVLASRDLGELVVGAIDRLMTGGISHENYASNQLTPREIRVMKRAKCTLSGNQSMNQDDTTAIPSPQSHISDSSIENDASSLDNEQDKCQRTLKHFKSNANTLVRNIKTANSYGPATKASTAVIMKPRFF